MKDASNQEDSNPFIQEQSDTFEKVLMRWIESGSPDIFEWAKDQPVDDFLAATVLDVQQWDCSDDEKRRAVTDALKRVARDAGGQTANGILSERISFWREPRLFFLYKLRIAAVLFAVAVLAVVAWLVASSWEYIFPGEFGGLDRDIERGLITKDKAYDHLTGLHGERVDTSQEAEVVLRMAALDHMATRISPSELDGITRSCSGVAGQLKIPRWVTDETRRIIRGAIRKPLHLSPDTPKKVLILFAPQLRESVGPFTVLCTDKFGTRSGAGLQVVSLDISTPCVGPMRLYGDFISRNANARFVIRIREDGLAEATGCNAARTRTLGLSQLCFTCNTKPMDWDTLEKLMSAELALDEATDALCRGDINKARELTENIVRRAPQKGGLAEGQARFIGFLASLLCGDFDRIREWAESPGSSWVRDWPYFDSAADLATFLLDPGNNPAERYAALSRKLEGKAEKLSPRQSELPKTASILAYGSYWAKQGDDLASREARITPFGQCVAIANERASEARALVNQIVCNARATDDFARTVAAAVLLQIGKETGERAEKLTASLAATEHSGATWLYLGRTAIPLLVASRPSFLTKPQWQRACKTAVERTGPLLRKNAQFLSWKEKVQWFVAIRTNRMLGGDLSPSTEQDIGLVSGSGRLVWDEMLIMLMDKAASVTRPDVNRAKDRLLEEELLACGQWVNSITSSPDFKDLPELERARLLCINAGIKLLQSQMLEAIEELEAASKILTPLSGEGELVFWQLLCPATLTILHRLQGNNDLSAKYSQEMQWQVERAMRQYYATTPPCCGFEIAVKDMTPLVAEWISLYPNSLPMLGEAYAGDFEGLTGGNLSKAFRDHWSGWRVQILEAARAEAKNACIDMNDVSLAVQEAESLLDSLEGVFQAKGDPSLAQANLERVSDALATPSRVSSKHTMQIPILALIRLVGGDLVTVGRFADNKERHSVLERQIADDAVVLFDYPKTNAGFREVTYTLLLEWHEKFPELLYALRKSPQDAIVNPLLVMPKTLKAGYDLYLSFLIPGERMNTLGRRLLAGNQPETVMTATVMLQHYWLMTEGATNIDKDTARFARNLLPVVDDHLRAVRKWMGSGPVVNSLLAEKAVLSVEALDWAGATNAIGSIQPEDVQDGVSPQDWRRVASAAALVYCRQPEAAAALIQNTICVQDPQGRIAASIQPGLGFAEAAAGHYEDAVLRLEQYFKEETETEKYLPVEWRYETTIPIGQRAVAGYVPGVSIGTGLVFGRGCKVDQVMKPVHDVAPLRCNDRLLALPAEEDKQALMEILLFKYFLELRQRRMTDAKGTCALAKRVFARIGAEGLPGLDLGLPVCCLAYADMCGMYEEKAVFSGMISALVDERGDRARARGGAIRVNLPFLLAVAFPEITPDASDFAKCMDWAYTGRGLSLANGAIEDVRLPRSLLPPEEKDLYVLEKALDRLEKEWSEAAMNVVADILTGMGTATNTERFHRIAARWQNIRITTEAAPDTE